jgi:hypothetical protein
VDTFIYEYSLTDDETMVSKLVEGYVGVINIHITLKKSCVCGRSEVIQEEEEDLIFGYHNGRPQVNMKIKH